MAAELLQYLDAANNFLSTMSQFSDFAVVQQRETDSIKNKLQALQALGMEDAAKVAAALQKLQLATGQRDSLLAVLASKVAEASAVLTAGGKAKTQDYTSFASFLPQRIWDGLAQPDGLAALADYLAEFLGLRHPSEPTCATVAALLVKVQKMDGTPLKSAYDWAKARLKSVCEQKLASRLPGPYLVKLPRAWDQLPEAWQQHAEQPVPPKVDLADLHALQKSVPMRSTHTSLR